MRCYREENWRRTNRINHHEINDKRRDKAPDHLFYISPANFGKGGVKRGVTQDVAKIGFCTPKPELRLLCDRQLRAVIARLN